MYYSSTASESLSLSFLRFSFYSVTATTDDDHSSNTACLWLSKKKRRWGRRMERKRRRTSKRNKNGPTFFFFVRVRPLLSFAVLFFSRSLDLMDDQIFSQLSITVKLLLPLSLPSPFYYPLTEWWSMLRFVSLSLSPALSSSFSTPINMHINER